MIARSLIRKSMLPSHQIPISIFSSRRRTGDWEGIPRLNWLPFLIKTVMLVLEIIWKLRKVRVTWQLTFSWICKATILRSLSLKFKKAWGAFKVSPLPIKESQASYQGENPVSYQRKNLVSYQSSLSFRYSKLTWLVLWKVILTQKKTP